MLYGIIINLLHSSIARGRVIGLSVCLHQNENLSET